MTPTVWIILAVVLVLALLAGGFWWMRKRRRSRDEFCSIVMLRSSPLKIAAHDVRGALRRALKLEAEIIDVPSPSGTGTAMAVLTEELPTLLVISERRPYVESETAETLALRFENQQVRQALRTHTAWASIDAPGTSALSKADRDRVHSVIAPIAAELLDEGCVLLYLKAEGRVALPGPETPAMLAAGRIDELFGDEGAHAPMVYVPADDRRIAAAQLEARKRLPEFISAFETQTPDPRRPFLFKARFVIGEDGETECLWLMLENTTSRGLIGKVENPPIHESIPKLGCKATVKIDDVIDWAYVGADNKPVGPFAELLIMKRVRSGSA